MNFSKPKFFDTRYKKGHVPWNKGMEFPKPAYKCRECGEKIIAPIQHWAICKPCKALLQRIRRDRLRARGRNGDGKRFIKLYGEEKPNAKLTWHDVSLIRQLSAEGVSARSLATKFELDLRGIYRILAWETWFHPPKRRPVAREVRA